MGRGLRWATSIGIWIYDANSGAEVNLLTGYTGWVSSVAFSPDGLTLAGGSWDDTIRLWDARTGKHRQTMEHEGTVTCVVYSPDGLKLASGSWDKTIRLWNVRTGKAYRFFRAHIGSRP